MLEAVLVGLIVVAAVAYAAWTLLPAALRLRAAERFSRWADRDGRPAGLVRMADTLERNARARLGGCSNCSPGHDGSRRRSGTRRNPD
jgi:hypothetical protein